nr:MAG TPA: hypothetical protein [Caudoviricetes sp.]
MQKFFTDHLGLAPWAPSDSDENAARFNFVGGGGVWVLSRGEVGLISKRRGLI